MEKKNRIIINQIAIHACFYIVANIPSTYTIQLHNRRRMRRERKEYNCCIEHTLLIVVCFLFHAITKLSLLRLSQYMYCKVHCYNVFVLLPNLPLKEAVESIAKNLKHSYVNQLHWNQLVLLSKFYVLQGH